LKEAHLERADDLPVIIHWLQQMGIEELIAQELPAQKWQLAGIKLWATTLQKHIGKS